MLKQYFFVLDRFPIIFQEQNSTIQFSVDLPKALADLRKKNIDQLNAELISERESQFSLRIKHKTGQLNETSELKKVRRKIAMIKTVINEMKLKDKE